MITRYFQLQRLWYLSFLSEMSVILQVKREVITLFYDRYTVVSILVWGRGLFLRKIGWKFMWYYQKDKK